MSVEAGKYKNPQGVEMVVWPPAAGIATPDGGYAFLGSDVSTGVIFDRLTGAPRRYIVTEASLAESGYELEVEPI